MIRKGLLVSALAAGAMIGATPAQSAVTLASVSSIINQLKANSTFSANNMEFTICQNGTCQTLFTGVAGLHNFNDLGGLNNWANTGSTPNTPGYFDNYRFTYSGVGGYFGNQTPPASESMSFQTLAVAPPPIPEPATWALMIFGFGVIGMAMRRRPVVINFG